MEFEFSELYRICIPLVFSFVIWYIIHFFCDDNEWRRPIYGGVTVVSLLTVIGMFDVEYSYYENLQAAIMTMFFLLILWNLLGGILKPSLIAVGLMCILLFSGVVTTSKPIWIVLDIVSISLSWCTLFILAKFERLTSISEELMYRRKNHHEAALSVYSQDQETGDRVVNPNYALMIDERIKLKLFLRKFFPNDTDLILNPIDNVRIQRFIKK